MDQVLDTRSDGANWWQTQQTNGNNHRNDSKLCKTKPVLSEAWAELSPPQRKERWRQNEEELSGGGGGGVGGWRGWVQVRRGKNPRQGESLDKHKGKTDSTTTNKQDPQDTPADLVLVPVPQPTYNRHRHHHHNESSSSSSSSSWIIICIFMRDQNLPPPLNNMLVGVITSTISPWGIKICHPLCAICWLG